MTASSTNNASTAAAVPRVPRAAGAPLRATIASLVQRVVRTGSLDAVETGEGREKRVLQIVHPRFVRRERLEALDQLVIFFQHGRNLRLRLIRQRRFLHQNIFGPA